MPQKKLTYPRHGRIKATGRDVIILGEGNVAGIKTYRVREPHEPDSLAADYGRGAVSVLGEANG